MTSTLLIIVLVVGLLLLALEIVALPGGIAGAFGLLLTGFGVWQSYLMWGPRVGNIILCICAAITVVLLALFMKAKTWYGQSGGPGDTGCRSPRHHGGALSTYGQSTVRRAAGGSPRHQQVYRPRPSHRGGVGGGLPYRCVRDRGQEI